QHRRPAAPTTCSTDDLQHRRPAAGTGRAGLFATKSYSPIRPDRIGQLVIRGGGERTELQ
ncbi:MAG: hypothetical protein P1U77_24945, partial [Rubripirellula sp.]|nr:hypothetical protein [Rubripirellula sp.]